MELIYLIGITLLSHGKMAEGMKDATQLIIGEQEQFNVLGLYEGNDIEVFKEDVYKAVKDNNTGDGVLIFVDLAGASPYNAASMNIYKFRKENIEVRIVTGVNLSMILETLTQRDLTDDLSELYKIALNAGCEGITELFEELEKGE